MATSALFRPQQSPIQAIDTVVGKFITEFKENKQLQLSNKFERLSNAYNSFHALLEDKATDDNDSTAVPADLIHTKEGLIKQTQQADDKRVTDFLQYQEQEKKLQEQLVAIREAKTAAQVQEVIKNGITLVKDNRVAIELENDLRDTQERIDQLCCRWMHHFPCGDSLYKRLDDLKKAQKIASNPDAISDPADLAHFYNTRVERISAKLKTLRTLNPNIQESAAEKKLIKTEAKIELVQEQKNNSLSKKIMVEFIRMYECLKNILHDLNMLRADAPAPLVDLKAKVQGVVTQVDTLSDKLNYKEDPSKRSGHNVLHFHKLFEGANGELQQAFLSGQRNDEMTAVLFASSAAPAAALSS